MPSDHHLNSGPRPNDTTELGLSLRVTDVRLNVDLADMTWIEFHRALEIIERGHSAAEAALPQVQAALDQRLTLTP